MSQPAPIHLCFYSNRCRWSKAFIDEITQTDLHKDFRFICVDPSPQRPALPAWLKQTPTLVIRGESEPRVDSEVMNWLAEQRMRRGPAQPAQGGSSAQASFEPEPYMDSEMGGGYGDQYSFLGTDTSAQGNGGLSMKHNFTYLNGQDAVSTKEASHFQGASAASGPSSKQSKKEALLNQQLEQYMKYRDQGMPQRVTRQ
jgi:hypothetical protein